MLAPPEPEAKPSDEENIANAAESTEDAAGYGAGENRGDNSCNNPEYNTSGTSEAEVEDLRKRYVCVESVFSAFVMQFCLLILSILTHQSAFLY